MNIKSQKKEVQAKKSEVQPQVEKTGYFHERIVEISKGGVKASAAMLTFAATGYALEIRTAALETIGAWVYRDILKWTLSSITGTAWHAMLLNAPLIAAGLGVAAGAAAYVGYKTLFSRTAEEVAKAKPVVKTPPRAAKAKPVVKTPPRAVKAKPVVKTPPVVVPAENIPTLPVVPVEKPSVPVFTKDVFQTLNQNYDNNDVKGQVQIINSAWRLFSRDPNRVYASMRNWMENGKFTDQQHRKAFVDGLVSCIRNVNAKTKNSLYLLIDEIIFNDNNLANKKASIFQTFVDSVDEISDEVKQFVYNRISNLFDFGKADGDEMEKFWHGQMQAFYNAFNKGIDNLLPPKKGKEKKTPTILTLTPKTAPTAPIAGTSATTSTAAPTITIPSTPTTPETVPLQKPSKGKEKKTPTILTLTPKTAPTAPIAGTSATTSTTAPTATIPITPTDTSTASTIPVIPTITPETVPSAVVDVRALLNQMKSEDAHERFQAVKGLYAAYDSVINIDSKIKILQAIITMFNDDSGPANMALLLINEGIKNGKFSGNGELQAIIDGCADFISSSEKIMQDIQNRINLTVTERVELKLHKQYCILTSITILGTSFAQKYGNIADRKLNVEKLKSALEAFKKEIAGTAIDNDIINKNIQTILDALKKPVTTTATTSTTSTTTTTTTSTTAPTATIPITPTDTSTASTIPVIPTITPETVPSAVVDVKKHRDDLANLADAFNKARDKERIDILNQIWDMFEKEGVDEGKNDMYVYYNKIVSHLFHLRLSRMQFRVFIDRFISCINKDIDNDLKKAWLRNVFEDIIWTGNFKGNKQFNIPQLIMENLGMNDTAKKFIHDSVILILEDENAMNLHRIAKKFAAQYAKELGISTTTPTTTAETAEAVPSAEVNIQVLLDQMKSEDALERFQALKELAAAYDSVINIDSKIKIIQAIITMFNDDSQSNASSAYLWIKEGIANGKFSDNSELQAIVDGCADFISSSGKIMKAIKNRIDLDSKTRDKLQEQKQNLIIGLITILGTSFAQKYGNIADRGLNVGKLKNVLEAFKKEIAGTAFATDIINKNIQTILDALKKPVTTTATTSTTSTTTTTTTSTITPSQQPQRVLKSEDQVALKSLLAQMKSMDVEERRKALKEIDAIYHSVGLNGKVDIINAMWNMFDFKGVIQEFDVVTYEIPNLSFPEIAEELHELNVEKVMDMFTIARDTLALIKKWIGDKKFSNYHEIQSVMYVCADYLSSLADIHPEIEKRKSHWRRGQVGQIVQECQNIAVSFVNVFAEEFIKTYKDIKSLDVQDFVKALAIFRNNNTSNDALVNQIEAILDVISEEVNIKINALLKEMQSLDAEVRENSLYFSSLYREAASYKNQSRLLQGLMTMVLKESDESILSKAGLLLEQLPLNNKDQYQILVDGFVNYLQDKDYAKLNTAEKQLIKFMNLSLLKYRKYAKQVKVDEWTKVLSKLEKEIENGENFKKWEIMTAGKKISQTKYGQYIPDETGKMTIEVDNSYLEEKQFKTEIANMRNAATV